jgi:hypothetical protein
VVNVPALLLFTDIKNESGSLWGYHKFDGARRKDSATKPNRKYNTEKSGAAAQKRMDV